VHIEMHSMIVDVCHCTLSLFENKKGFTSKNVIISTISKRFTF